MVEKSGVCSVLVLIGKYVIHGWFEGVPKPGDSNHPKYPLLQVMIHVSMI